MYEHASKECVCLRRAMLRPCFRFLGLFNDALASECILRLMIIQRNLSAQFHRHQQPFIETIKHCGVLNLTIFYLLSYTALRRFLKCAFPQDQTGIKCANLRFDHTISFTHNVSSIKHLFNQYFKTFCIFDPANGGYCGLLYSTTSITLEAVNVNPSQIRTVGSNALRNTVAILIRHFGISRI